MKRVQFLLCGVAAIAVSPAAADNLTISTATSSPVATATAANSTPGNIVITSGGSVAGNFTSTVANVTSVVPAVTLNSNNTVSNAGTISNTFGSGAIGVNILGGNTGSFTNSGTISIPATGSPFNSSGQFGILLNGNGTFTGDIVNTANSSVTVSGVGPTGIAIQAPLTGNLTLGGTIQASGSTAMGVVVAAPITGAFSNTGSISTVSELNSTSVVNISPGSAVAIGSSITGGIYNSATGTFSTVGSAPALIIAPSVAGSVAPLTIGTVSDIANPGFSLLNRGNITAIGNQPGVGTSAIQFGSSAGVTSGLPAILSGGFYNNGSVAATATSANTNATSSEAAASDATTIVVGFDTSLNQLYNDAHGNITAVTGGPLGGSATALSIQPGASLPVLTNFGNISAAATTTDPTIASLSAHGIQDLSGTLTTIVNSGTISASTSALNTGTMTAVAADLSVATTPISFSDTGTVIGDILFGHAAGSSLTIEGANATVSGRIQSAGSVNITVSGNGTGGTLFTSSATNVGNLTIGSGGTLNLGIGQATTVVSGNGTATFLNGSHLLLTPISLLPTTGNITLVHAGGGLTIGNLTTLTSTITPPFLYTSETLTSTATNLVLTAQLKTAGQIGLTGNAVTLYGTPANSPVVQAVLQDAQFSAAFVNLGNLSALQSTLNQMGPLVSGAPMAMAETITDSSIGSVGARQRSLLLNDSPEADGGIWTQGFYNVFSDSSQNSYNATGTGGVIGADYSQAGKGHFGAALTLLDATAVSTSAAMSKVAAQWVDGTLYLGLRSGNFFFDGQFNAAGASLQGTRTVNVGSLTRTAVSKDWTEFLISQGLTAGYFFDLGDFKIAPLVSIDAMLLSDSSYNETGGGTGVDLAISARSQTSVRAFAGVTGTGTYQVDQFRIVPQFLAGYSEEFLTNPAAVDAVFISVPGLPFAIPGPTIDSSKLVAGANVNFSINRWSLSLNYNISDEAKAIDQSAGATLTARF